MQHMNFDELGIFLEKRLRDALPGADAHNKMKPRLPDGSPLQIKHTTTPRQGGVLILFYPDKEGVMFPLIKRPSYEGIHSGQMALPGGRIEADDPDLKFTALRETREEIGVAEDKVEIVGTLSEFYVAASNYIVLPVVGLLNHKPEFVPEPREVEEVVAAPLHEFMDPAYQKEKEMVVRNDFRMICPYFDLAGKVVWGATAMMLSELYEVLSDH